MGLVTPNKLIIIFLNLLNQNPSVLRTSPLKNGSFLKFPFLREIPVYPEWVFYLVSRFRPRPIFKVPFGKAIVSAEMFHFSVRNGKRWFHLAPATRIEKPNIFVINFLDS